MNKKNSQLSRENSKGGGGRENESEKKEESTKLKVKTRRGAKSKFQQGNLSKVTRPSLSHYIALQVLKKNNISTMWTSVKWDY